MPYSGGIFPLKRPKVVPCSVFVTKKKKTGLFYMMPFFLLKNVTERCLPHLQGPTCSVLPSGVLSSLHPCPTRSHLWKPSFLLLCYLQDTTHCSHLILPSDTSRPLRSCCWHSFSPPPKNACGSSTPALPFLLPVGKWGSGSGC